MGWFGRDVRNGRDTQVEAALADPDADPGAMERAAGQLIGKLIELGIEGKGPFDGATAVARDALAGRSAKGAVKRIVRDHRRMAAVGGFLTGLGGFFTMSVSLPANVLEFYVVATRMVAATAKVRGYDIDNPAVRTAVLATLVGADSGEVLAKAGLSGGGRLTSMATRRLPGPALMVVNKALGFRLLAQASRSTIARLGKAVPVVGGGIGAGLDAYLLGQIARNADREFPQLTATQG